MESLIFLLAEYWPLYRQEHRSHGDGKESGQEEPESYLSMDKTGTVGSVPWSNIRPETAMDTEIELSLFPSRSRVSRFLVWSQDALFYTTFQPHGSCIPGVRVALLPWMLMQETPGAYRQVISGMGEMLNQAFHLRRTYNQSPSLPGEIT